MLIYLVASYSHTYLNRLHFKYRHFKNYAKHVYCEACFCVWHFLCSTFCSLGIIYAHVWLCSLSLTHVRFLSSPTDCSPLDFSVHWILQAGTLEWIAISCPRGSSEPRGGTHVSCVSGHHGRRILYHYAPWEPLSQLGNPACFISGWSLFSGWIHLIENAREWLSKLLNIWRSQDKAVFLLSQICMLKHW